MADPEGYFEAIATGGEAVVFHAVFMAIVIGIVAVGIQRGIELVVRVIVPGLVVLMIALAIYASTLPGASAAYAFYLSPDLGLIAENWRSIVPAAAGQAFFTLSLGMGALITYASYLGDDENLIEDSSVIIGLDVAIAVLAGLVVFPILFATDVAAVDPGPGAVFVALAGAFAAIPFGWLLGTVFFGAFAMAALSSAISLIEVVVAYAIDEHGLDRPKATALVGGGIFLVGIPVALDGVMLELYDRLAADILLVIGGILLMIFVGWVVYDEAIDELEKGIDGLGPIGTVWIWLVRIPVVVVLLVALSLAIVGYVEFLRTTFW